MWLIAVLAALAGGTALFVASLWVAKQHRVRARHDPHSHYKAIVEQGHDGIVIVDPTTQRIEFCNTAFTTRLGYSQDDTAALGLADIFVDASLAADALTRRLLDVNSGGMLQIQQRCKNGSLVDVDVRRTLPLG